jgi:hypothetical protein
MKRDSQKKVRNFYLLVVFVVIASLVAMALLDRGEQADGQALDKLARCLTSQGVKMYGAYWCGHCKKQKEAFGAAFSQLDYVECADPSNPQAQAQECEDAGITSYPTWHFGLGDRITGEITMEKLAAKAGCSWGEVERPGPELAPAPSDGSATAPAEGQPTAPTDGE